VADSSPVTDLMNVRPLVCAECGIEAPPNAKGWQSYLRYDLREDEWPEAFVFCPEWRAAGVTRAMRSRPPPALFRAG